MARTERSRRRTTGGRWTALVWTASLHGAVILGLSVTYAERERALPPFEVALVSPISIPMARPPTIAGLRRAEREPTPPTPRIAARVEAAGIPTPIALQPAAGEPDRYRLLAAPFNACPQLIAGSRVYREGASERDCLDVDPHDRSRAAPPRPRQYVLDSRLQHIEMGSKDDALPPSIKILPEPLR